MDLLKRPQLRGVRLGEAAENEYDREPDQPHGHLVKHGCWEV